ncbi:MAG TPA: nitrous oxide-stimulated promoter family protein [Thermoplasmata archaeon]
MGSEARAAREKKTVSVMIGIFCRGNHRPKGTMCSECSDLLTYANNRVDKCPLIRDKPTCAKCPVHCYESTMRERIRAVMRYSGPRMLYRHPILSIRHKMDGSKGKMAE